MDYSRLRHSYSGVTSMPNKHWISRLITSNSRLLSRHAYRNQFEVSASDSPTIYYSNRQNANPDVLDRFLHHLGLPVEVVVTLNELISDQNPVLLTINSSSLTGMGRSMCHSVRCNVFQQHLKPIEFLRTLFCPQKNWRQASKLSPIL